MGVSALDIAVCGCGPAGLAAALFLHRAGHRVRLIERFAEPKPLGSGLMLQPTGLAVLRHLGLEQGVLALGHPIARMFGRAAPSGRVVLDVRYDALGPGRFALAVHRASLFGPLFDAVAREGIAIDTNVEVVALDRGSGDRPLVVDAKGVRHGPFDLVVDALGARSPLAAALRSRSGNRTLRYGALWATLQWPDGVFAKHTLEQRYRRASTMVGVLPIGRRPHSGVEEAAFFWSLRGNDYAEWRANGLDAWKEQVARQWPEAEHLLREISHVDDLVLARYDHHTLTRPYGRRLACIGDAAHATSPQLGQGANMGLLDAMTLADALAQASDDEFALKDYARRRRGHVRLYQAMSRLFTPFYQSDSAVLPWTRDRLVAPMTRISVVNKLLASLVSGGWGLRESDLERAGVSDRATSDAQVG